MQNRLTKLSKSLLSVVSITLLSPLVSHAQAPNPNYFYMVNGELISRSISVGDPSNWSTNIQGREGESAGGKVSVAPINFKATG
ncbi:hypothetical protein ACCS91_39295, partial [Rhizobium ruizarguesonis]